MCQIRFQFFVVRTACRNKIYGLMAYFPGSISGRNNMVNIKRTHSSSIQYNPSANLALIIVAIAYGFLKNLIKLIRIWKTRTASPITISAPRVVNKITFPTNVSANHSVVGSLNRVSSFTYPSCFTHGGFRKWTYIFYTNILCQSIVIKLVFGTIRHTHITPTAYQHIIIRCRNSMSFITNPISFGMSILHIWPNPFETEFSGKDIVILRKFHSITGTIRASFQSLKRHLPFMPPTAAPVSFITRRLWNWAKKFISAFFSKIPIINLKIRTFGIIRASWAICSAFYIAIGCLPFMPNGTSPKNFGIGVGRHLANQLNTICSGKVEIIRKFLFEVSSHNSKCLLKRRSLGATPRGICLEDYSILFAPRPIHYNRTCNLLSNGGF